MRIAPALAVILTLKKLTLAHMWSHVAPQPLQDRDGVFDISTQILTVQLRKLEAIDRYVITRCLIYYYIII